MSASIIQIDYDSARSVGDSFTSQAEDCTTLLRQLRQGLAGLQDGGWEGSGADAFFAEMEQVILPAIERLILALNTGQSTMLQTATLLREAEESAAALLRSDLAEGGNTNAGDGGVLGFIGDIFGGALDEAGNMISGLVNTVLHPVETIEGLVYGITHPDKLWEAFSQPYVDDWNSGHPGRAIGRGALFVGSLLIGTKGLDKLGKGGRIAETASATGRAGETTGALGRVGRLINTVNRTLTLDEAEMAQYLTSKGHVVEVLAEGGESLGDFAVDGLRTELKTISNVTSADPSKSVARTIVDAGRQAPNIIADVRRQPNFTNELAERAARRAYGADKAQRVQSIRLIGDSFDFIVPRVP